MANWLEKFRTWVDGPDYGDPAAQIAGSGPPRGTSREQMMEIARAINDLMRDEMLDLPQTGGAADVPERFMVYLSAEESRKWPGKKRDALARKLSELSMEAARGWAGDAPLSASAIAVEIETDAKLRGDKFRVEAVWGAGQDDERTVTFTPAPAPEPPPDEDEGTVYEPEDEGTVYEPFYLVEVWRDGRREGCFGAVKPDITIGRKKTGSAPDVALAGDTRVSGVHARLRLDETGHLWLKAGSRNATHVDGRAYREGDAETEVRAGMEIKIYDFTLKLLAGTHLADETWKMG
jgi:hypothetical protein